MAEDPNLQGAETTPPEEGGEEQEIVAPDPDEVWRKEMRQEVAALQKGQNALGYLVRQAQDQFAKPRTPERDERIDTLLQRIENLELSLIADPEERAVMTGALRLLPVQFPGLVKVVDA